MDHDPVDLMVVIFGLALTELKAGTSLFWLPTQPRGSLGHTLSWGDLNCRKPQEKPREKTGVIFVANLLVHRMLFLFLEKWKGRFSLLSHPYATTRIPQGEQTATTWKTTSLGDPKSKAENSEKYLDNNTQPQNRLSSALIDGIVMQAL